MTFARGGYIHPKQWPYGIDDLELIDGVYQKTEKPKIQLKLDTENLEMWAKILQKNMDELELEALKEKKSAGNSALKSIEKKLAKI